MGARRNTFAVSKAFSRPGGFCTFTTSYYPSIPATANADAIIEVVGAPAELNLHHVRAYLRHQVRTSLRERLMSGRAVLAQHAEATLLLLDDGIGLPARTWLAILLGERMMIAALLLVVLGLRAIRLAHVNERNLVGAMP